MRIRALFLASFAAFAVATGAQVHEHPNPSPAVPAIGVEKLSPDLRGLLREEMVGLQGGMLELLPAVVAADWPAIARTAARMRAGFVLAQQLTSAQREELHRSLPEGFLQRDEEFHELAGDLAVAAEARQPELVSFYVYKLTDSCTACHSRYATERFPGFLSSHQTPQAHHH